MRVVVPGTGTAGPATVVDVTSSAPRWSWRPRLRW
jgi:hypothetical protein